MVLFGSYIRIFMYYKKQSLTSSKNQDGRHKFPREMPGVAVLKHAIIVDKVHMYVAVFECLFGAQ